MPAGKVATLEKQAITKCTEYNFLSIFYLDFRERTTSQENTDSSRSINVIWHVLKIS
jgi:hypothetical protein